MKNNTLASVAAVAALFAVACGGPSEKKAALALPIQLGSHPVAVFAQERWVPVDANLPESRHGYLNNTFRRWIIQAPACAQALRVRLSRVDVEQGYDAVVLRDGQGKLIQYWTGSDENIVSEAVPGAELHIEFVSDYSVTDWGFAVSAVEMIAREVSCPPLPMPRCLHGSVALPQPAAECACPPPPLCRSMQSLTVDLTTGGGVSGLQTGYRVDGSGAIWSLQGVAGHELQAHPYGQANMTPVRDLVLALHAAGLLGSDRHIGDAGNMSRSITTSFDGVRSTLSWPADDPPPGLALDALTAFKQILSCNDGSALAATCTEGNTCFETVCVPSTCDNEPCPLGSRCEMQRRDCAQVPCASAPVCTPTGEGCTCTQEHDPVCGNDGDTYGNDCLASCAGVGSAHIGACGVEGDSCGGLLARACQDHFICRYGLGQFEAPYPDAAGSCVQEGYCEDPRDCDVYPHVLCRGAWSCAEARCRYQCDPEPVDAWQRAPLDFGSAQPYANDQLLGWRIDGAPGAAQIRLSFSSFDLEDGYDYVVLYDDAWHETQRYRGSLGAFTSDPIEGDSMHLVFGSDASVVRSGFRVDAVESQF